MDYPQRFFNRMFAEARPLELARRFAVYAGIAAFLAAGAAGLMVWARRAQRVRPYFLHMGENGEWTAYSSRRRDGVAEAPWHRLMQESIAAGLAARYFEVGGDFMDGADASCGCGGCAGNASQCRLCCGSAAGLFDGYSRDILPKWRDLFWGGARQALAVSSARPVGKTDENGGMWEISGDLISNRGNKKITGYMRIARDKNGHAETLGFHAAEFYFYAE